MNLTQINEGLLLILYRLSQLEQQLSEPCSCSGELVVEGKILESINGQFKELKTGIGKLAFETNRLAVEQEKANGSLGEVLNATNKETLISVLNDWLATPDAIDRLQSIISSAPASRELSPAKQRRGTKPKP